MSTLDQAMNYLADHAIVEEGDKNGWHYRLYSNNRLECYCLLDPTPKNGTAWNGLYYATYNVNKAFPYSFKSRPLIVSSCQAGTMGFLGDITFDNQRITSYDMYRAGAGNVGAPLAVYCAGERMGGGN